MIFSNEQLLKIYPLTNFIEAYDILKHDIFLSKLEHNSICAPEIQISFAAVKFGVPQISVLSKFF